MRGFYRETLMSMKAVKTRGVSLFINVSHATFRHLSNGFIIITFYHFIDQVFFNIRLLLKYDPHVTVESEQTCITVS